MCVREPVVVLIYLARSDYVREIVGNGRRFARVMKRLAETLEPCASVSCESYIVCLSRGKVMRAYTCVCDVYMVLRLRREVNRRRCMYLASAGFVQCRWGSCLDW